MSKDPFAFEIKEENVEKNIPKKTTRTSKGKKPEVNIKIDKEPESLKEKYEKMPIEKLMSIYFMIYGSTIREKKSIIVSKIIKGLNEME